MLRRGSPLSAPEIAERIGGRVRALGAPALRVSGVALPQAATPDEVAVLLRATGSAPSAGVLVVLPVHPGRPGAAIIETERPRAALAALIGHFHPERTEVPGIHPSAWIAPGASLADEVSVGPGVVVESGARVGEGSVLRARCYVGRDAVLGRRCRLEPGAKVLDGTILGDEVVVGSGTVLGGTGFGYLPPDEQGFRAPIPQVGRVLVGDGTHFGALCVVDRGTLGDTVIGAAVRVDNAVVVGHNSQVEAGAVLVSQVGISGSVRIGAGAVLAGQSGVSDHRSVGAGAVLTAKSATFRDVPPGEVYSGNPARPRRAWAREKAALSRVARERLQGRGTDHGEE